MSPSIITDDQRRAYVEYARRHITYGIPPYPFSPVEGTPWAMSGTNAVRVSGDGKTAVTVTADGVVRVLHEREG